MASCSAGPSIGSWRRQREPSGSQRCPTSSLSTTAHTAPPRSCSPPKTTQSRLIPARQPIKMQRVQCTSPPSTPWSINYGKIQTHPLNRTRKTTPRLRRIPTSGALSAPSVIPNEPSGSAARGASPGLMSNVPASLGLVRPKHRHGNAPTADSPLRQKFRYLSPRL